MKRILICGAGEVGRYAAEVLAQEGLNVTVIDVDATRLRQVEESIDVRSVKGSSCHPKTLKDAGVEDCDLLMAATNRDEFNLLSASLAKRMGARRVVARIHHRAYIDDDVVNFKKKFRIDHLICPEQLTSLAIAGNLEDPGVMAIERFAQNKIEMHRYQLNKESEAIGTKLSDLKLPAGVRLAIVERDGNHFTPGGDTVLSSQDIVTLIGEPQHFKEVQSMFHQSKRSSNRIALMGGTSMAEWLAEDLKHRDFSIRLFETDRKRAIELSERLAHLTVLHSDPTDPNEFREEHLEECTAFIAVSEDDEHNILGALQAKQLGAPLTAAVIHSPTFLPLLENLGIDWPFSPRIVAAKQLLKLVDDSLCKRVATLAPDVADVFELGPIRGGELGKALKDIHLPKGAFVAAIQRGEEVHVPGANDMVEKGDVIVVIGPVGSNSELQKIFLAS